MKKSTSAPALASALFALLLTASTLAYGEEVMLIDDFHDDAPAPANAPAPIGGATFDTNTRRHYLVSRLHYRQFDFLVSGTDNIESFIFTYTPEWEIEPADVPGHPTKGFQLDGIKADGTSAGGVSVFLDKATSHVSTSYLIDSAPDRIPQLFPGQIVMLPGQRIRVTEYFDVVQCSRDNDSTVYSIKWSPCNSTDVNSDCDNGVCTDCARRSILVETSAGGMRIPNIEIQNHPLDICAAHGGAPSDIVVSFRNKPNDSGKDIGSAMKTFHTIEFSMKQDVFANGGGVFPPADISLEGGGVSVPLTDPSLPAGFYYYSGAPTYRVTLNFDLLTGPYTDGPLGANSPLVSGFIPEPTPIYNELKEGGTISLRFKDARFDCRTALFYPQLGFPDPYGMADCSIPEINYTFFGNGNKYFNFSYSDMCGTPQAQAHDFGNYHNNFTVTPIGTAHLSPGGGSDIRLNESAELDYSYVSTGFDSPFAFRAPQSPDIYFWGGIDTYQATLVIPTDYALDLATVYYFSDPNGAGTPVLLSQYTFGPDGNGNNVYTFTDPIIGPKGRITNNVQLINCPINQGILHTFTAKIQAIHNGCADCAYTITCINAQMFAHCQGDCGPGTPPQQTEKFSLRRKTFGTDPSTGTGINPSTGIGPDPATFLPATEATPGVRLERVYADDEIEVNCEGFIVAGAANSKLAFRMQYAPGVTPGSIVNFQFFKFKEGTLTYDDANGGSGSFPFVEAADCSAIFDTTGSWPASGATCNLYVNFHAADFLTTIQKPLPLNHKVTLKLQMIIKVKCMTGTGAAVAAGHYDLALIEGQFWNGNPCCDYYHADLKVLNVRTDFSAEIKKADFADAFLGWGFASGVCDRIGLIRTAVSGGLKGMYDFPFEFRQIIRWPDPVTLNLPAGVHFNLADFTVYRRPGFWPGAFYNDAARRITEFSAGPAGQTIAFSTFGTGSGDQKPWPWFAQDGLPIDMALRVSLTNDCPATTNLDGSSTIGDVTLDVPFTSQFLSLRDCQTAHDAQPADLNATDYLKYSAAPYNSISLSPAVDTYHVTSSSATIEGIDFQFNGWGDSSIRNAWVRITSGGVNVSAVYVNRPPSPYAASLTSLGTTATFTSTTPHGFQPNQLVSISGALQTDYNGVFQVILPVTANTFTYTMATPPGVPATAASVPIRAERVANASPLTRGGPGNLTATFYDPLTAHGLATSQEVRVSGALQTDYNGVFRITVLNPHTFTYEMTSDPGGTAQPATAGGFITADEVTTPDAYGYFHIGTIFSGPGNSAHLSFDLTLAGCNPGHEIPVTAEYGYFCSGYPTGTTPDPTPCVTQVTNFSVYPEGSGLAMDVIPVGNTSGSPCDSYHYTVLIRSTQRGDVEDPQLTITLPAGMSFTATPPQTYVRNDIFGIVSGNLTTVNPLGNDYTWNINHDVYADTGMPPADAFVTLDFFVTGNCSPGGNINFHLIGHNICGGDIPCITCDPPPETLLFTQPAKPSATTSVAISPVVSCTNSLYFSIDLTGINHAGDLTANVHATYNNPPTFGFVSSSPAPQNTSPGSIDWVIHPVSGTSLNITAELSIPHGFCGTFSLTNVIELFDVTTCCTNTVQYTNIASQYICCATNCCDGCTTNDFVSYTITVRPGINYLVNQLCHGTENLVGDVLRNPPNGVPGGTVVLKWNEATQLYKPPNVFSGVWSDPTMTLEPGVGFVLNNISGSNFFLTFYGCEATNCPLPCLPDTNGCVLVGRLGIGTATWTNLSSCPPICGTQLRIWNGTGFNLYDHDDQHGWLPPLPLLAVGQSVFVCLADNPNCCTNNLEVNGSFEVTSPVMTPNTFNNSLDRTTGVPGWTTTAGNFLEVWCNPFGGTPASLGTNQLEINAQSTDQTVSQRITGLSTNCPVTFCFDYRGRFGLVEGTPNNNFTVTISGGYTLSVPLNPAAGGWITFCTNFVPTASTLTMSFRGQPHSTANGPGGAHIDNVSLTQCCTNVPPCPPDTKLNVERNGGNIVLSWNGPSYHLQTTTSLTPIIVWNDIPGTSPVTFPVSDSVRFFRLVCP